MAGARTEGWLAARIVAGIAGALLVLRGAFGREGGRLVLLLAGVLVLRRAFPGLFVRAGAGARAPPRRRPEVIEVKSPAELEPGIASASPKPTFPNRVDR